MPTRSTKDPAGLSKEPRPSHKAGDGVFYSLALTFGTLLSSQGTDASFVLTLSGFPPGASLRSFVFPTLPDPFSVPFPVQIPFPAPCWSGVSAFSLSLSGLTDFIRSLRVGFPSRFGTFLHADGVRGFPLRWSRKRTGRPRPDANRVRGGRPNG
ncbi:hypothetical protein CTZ27_16200 [Streptomyces griseocarneus]|nr:hypothetical protein CTZ27_16200 [Streptomyces griseocarneus]